MDLYFLTHLYLNIFNRKRYRSKYETDPPKIQVMNFKYVNCTMIWIICGLWHRFILNLVWDYRYRGQVKAALSLNQTPNSKRFHSWVWRSGAVIASWSIFFKVLKRRLFKASVARRSVCRGVYSTLWCWLLKANLIVDFSFSVLDSITYIQPVV